MKERLVAIACVVGFIGLIIFGILSDTSRTSRGKIQTSGSNGDDSQTHINRGKAKADKGEYFEAIIEYDIAIKLNPADAKSYYYRGKAKEVLGLRTAAIADYGTAIRLDPNNARAYYYRGLVKNDIVGHSPRGRGWEDLVKALKLAEKMDDRKLHSAIKDARYP